MPRISVVIPTLNEADAIEPALIRLSQIPGLELIVSDGGSADGTVTRARPYATVVIGPAGRALQMNRGARRATGETLLFLHADSTLTPAAAAELSKTLADPEIVGGAFRLAIDSARWSLRLLSAAANLRTRLTRTPYGDQGIFVRRAAFDRLGGFPAIPIMEDLEFARRLKRAGRTAILGEAVQTSSRRWDREGVLHVTLRNRVLVLLYFLGVSPDRLARWYRPVR
jgi:rSAM/selenodomain-associated transferase 2